MSIAFKVFGSNALRTVLKAAAVREERRVLIDIVD